MKIKITLTDSSVTLFLKIKIILINSSVKLFLTNWKNRRNAVHNKAKTN